MRNLFKLKMRILTILLLGLLAVTTYSCDKDDDPDPIIEQTVTLDTSDATLEVGSELVVTPKFTPDTEPQRSYSWTSSNLEVVEVSAKSDNSAVLTAKAAGTSTITFSSSDGEHSISFTITVPEEEVVIEDDGILKVLAIGNSFSEDAVENYLYEMGAAENVPMVIGNLYIGGASLDLHWTNAQEDAAKYDYRKIEDGNKTNSKDTPISVAVADENWDYISFQQVSSNSGQYETFVTPLPALVEYVKSISTNPEAKYILHQTWAYDETSDHSGFANYDNDQVKMFEAIVDAYQQAQTLAGMDLIIPAGTAIQNGRNTLVGDNFTRDGYHLDLGIGRYTAASTWFEALTGINVIGNAFKPEAISDTEAEIAQHSAHAAVAAPKVVTPLPAYAGGDAGPLTAGVYISFGNKVAAKWNTLTGPTEGSSIENLQDENDAYTDISLVVTKRFNNINEVGATETDTDLNMPSDVSRQSYYGNSNGVWLDLEVKESQIKLTGLDSTLKYDLCFFGSRMDVSDNRETKYTVEGENSETVLLQTANNSSNIVCTNGIQPDANGEVTITLTAGENNDNGFGFYYLNAMKLAPSE